VAPIRVLIVDDHKLFADAIGPALQRQGVEVIGVATNGADAIDIVRVERPDAVLIDIGLPDKSGLVVGSEIQDESPGTTLIAVTALDDPHVMKQAVKAGFQGFLTKDTNLQRFVTSVRAILDGELMFPRMSTRGNGKARGPRFLPAQLTSREREVLALLSQGASSQTVAASLGIAPNTVRTHVQNILSKLQVHSRLEAVAFAVRSGVVAGGRHPVAVSEWRVPDE
jgi:DNA-binding NarL/FixJ family response regulator